MDKFVIIDGHAILHRAYHALPPLTTADGQQMNAVYGFASMLLRIVEELAPTHIAVAFDLPAPTFRKKLFAGYQSKRPKMEDGLSGQIPLVRHMLDIMHIAAFACEGFEADDVMGTMAQQLVKHRMDVVIVTGDRDLLQLVNGHVKLYMPIKGISDSKLFGEKEVEEKFGIPPLSIIDYKALIGDQSDNYPGVAGIGPKTAVALIKQFGTIETLYKDITTVEKEGLRQKLIANKDNAFLSKELATIVHTAPVTVAIDECKVAPWNNEDILRLFEAWQFRSLLSRLQKNGYPKKREQLPPIPVQKEPQKMKKEEENGQITLF